MLTTIYRVGSETLWVLKL